MTNVISRGSCPDQDLRDLARAIIEAIDFPIDAACCCTDRNFCRHLHARPDLMTRRLAELTGRLDYWASNPGPVSAANLIQSLRAAVASHPVNYPLHDPAGRGAT